MLSFRQEFYFFKCFFYLERIINQTLNGNSEAVDVGKVLQEPINGLKNIKHDFVFPSVDQI